MYASSRSFRLVVLDVCVCVSECASVCGGSAGGWLAASIRLLCDGEASASSLAGEDIHMYDIYMWR